MGLIIVLIVLLVLIAIIVCISASTDLLLKKLDNSRAQLNMQAIGGPAAESENQSEHRAASA